SRPSTRSRKLARTESPTSRAPASTPVAVATPSSTARFVRQYHARLRASRVEVCMTQLVSHGKLPGQIDAVGHDNQNGLLEPVQLHQQIRHNTRGSFVHIAGGLIAKQQE